MSGTTNPTNTTGAATTGVTMTSGAGTIPTGGSEQITIQYQTFMSNTSWPVDLILDCCKSNWLEWGHCLNMIANQCCFTEYPHGTLPCPNPTMYAQSARNWKRSNCTLRGFILEHISKRDYKTASIHAISHDLYVALQTVHQNQGIHAQVHIMKEALDTHFSPIIPLSQTLDKLKHLMLHRYRQIGQQQVNDNLYHECSWQQPFLQCTPVDDQWNARKHISYFTQCQTQSHTRRRPYCIPRERQCPT